MTSVLTATQGALAAENEALFGYALLGPRLGGADLTLVRSCIGAHTRLRDSTVAAIVVAGDTPVSPRPDYPELYPVADAAAARGRAVELEDRCSTAWRYLYAQLATRVGSSMGERVAAQHALTASAVRAMQWRRAAGSARPTVAFPGIG